MRVLRVVGSATASYDDEETRAEGHENEDRSPKTILAYRYCEQDRSDKVSITLEPKRNNGNQEIDKAELTFNHRLDGD